MTTARDARFRAADPTAPSLERAVTRWLADAEPETWAIRSEPPPAPRSPTHHRGAEPEADVAFDELAGPAAEMEGALGFAFDAAFASEPPPPSGDAEPAFEPAIELDGTERAPAEPPAPPPALLDGAERRTTPRYELYRHVVRASVHAEASHAFPGRVRNVSLDGGLFVETSNPLPFRCDVLVELILGDGARALVLGRVVRRPGDGMAIKLLIDDRERGVLGRLVEDALVGSESCVPRVVVRPSAQDPLSATRAALSRRWLQVLHAWDDDASHQAFIDACLSERQLDLALAAYRHEKAARPDDPRPETALSQIGTILSFMALDRPKSDGAVAKPRPLTKLLLLLFGLIGAAVLGLTYLRMHG